MKTFSLGGLLLALAAALPAAAINKCVVDGKPVFQDAPCDDQRETVAQGREREKRIEAYHRELDQLARQGVGLQRETPPAPQEPPKRDEGDGMFHARSRAQIRAEQQAAMARHREETERKNAESAARLTRMVDDMAGRCGGVDPTKNKPRIGMSDAEFRECTIHARFGGIRQVVAVERDHKPLRLYIFMNEPHRVYSVDGIVTAITP